MAVDPERNPADKALKQQDVKTLYKRLLRYVWPHKGAFLISVLGLALYASAQPVLAHLMGLVEETLRDPTEQKILLLIGLLMGTFFYRGVGTFLGKYFIAIVGRNVVHSLRVELFGKMTRLPSAFYDGESSGRLISRVTFDVDQVSGASTRALTTLIQEGLTVIFLMGYLIYLDYTLTLVFLVLVPFIVAVVGLASRFFRRYSRRVQQSVGDVTQVTNDSIKGYREVRTFGGVDYERSRFTAASEYNRKQALKFELTNAISVPLTQQIVSIGLGVMIFVMFQRVAAGSMTSADFFQFITAASLIAKPLRALTDINAMVQRGLAAAESIFTVLDADEERDTGTQTIDRANGIMSLENVVLQYAGAAEPAVKSVSLDITAGTSVAIVGKSGSGKTSLVNMLPRFYDVSDGVIRLDGIDLRDLTLDSLRRQIAIVGQQVTLFDGSVRDNIAYGRAGQYTDEQVLAAARAAHADEFIEQLPNGYDTRLGENGVLLSGGQRQRIAIARAILKDAPVLILDEATSALDTGSERHIQAAMEEVMKGRTTFVIAHRLSTIEHVDRILVMDSGRVVEDGTHLELLEQGGIYSQLYLMQFGSEGKHV
ncbi:MULTISPECIES: lipid A export permease/ATP-binding protein MsbA [unclassified Oceanobacter]|uniref:lipid A export permease/ATP-binding protein MsbA n=1 Tax=unclassified Oceanobacter TaxID=2620260 RepID=UPI002733E0A7|nr:MULTISPECIES: lipid A export permease/ATP-binding protein MsbA [unclassified Oceanobacter]MDP2608571.1 lipid A export permease/ATP-binding protein MsbA [Oceanobacter sp. 1_MG-2023]MDP2611667.1 lipid A export permease/ATP-binding protein MsbA [Oceanobacter sp. 2_MG-2023]